MPNYFGNTPMYMQELQSMRDRIDGQMKQIQQQSQMQQPVQQPITQNFQLAPNPSNNELEAKYANSFDEVKNTFVMKTGVFTNKDFSTIWIKDVTGNIRTFKTEEVIELDAKDREILDLQKQVNELKGMIENAQYDNGSTDEQVKSTKSSRVSSNKSGNAK